jgi:hypothetical protein
VPEESCRRAGGGEQIERTFTFQLDEAPKVK